MRIKWLWNVYLCSVVDGTSSANNVDFDCAFEASISYWQSPFDFRCNRIVWDSMPCQLESVHNLWLATNILALHISVYRQCNNSTSTMKMLTLPNQIDRLFHYEHMLKVNKVQQKKKIFCLPQKMFEFFFFFQSRKYILFSLLISNVWIWSESAKPSSMRRCNAFWL